MVFVVREPRPLSQCAEVDDAGRLVGGGVPRPYLPLDETRERIQGIKICLLVRALLCQPGALSDATTDSRESLAVDAVDKLDVEAVGEVAEGKFGEVAEGGTDEGVGLMATAETTTAETLEKNLTHHQP